MKLCPLPLPLRVEFTELGGHIASFLTLPSRASLGATRSLPPPATHGYEIICCFNSVFPNHGFIPLKPSSFNRASCGNKLLLFPFMDFSPFRPIFQIALLIFCRGNLIVWTQLLSNRTHWWKSRLPLVYCLYWIIKPGPRRICSRCVLSTSCLTFPSLLLYTELPTGSRVLKITSMQPVQLDPAFSSLTGSPCFFTSVSSLLMVTKQGVLFFFSLFILYLWFLS